MNPARIRLRYRWTKRGKAHVLTVTRVEPRRKPPARRGGKAGR